MNATEFSKKPPVLDEVKADRRRRRALECQSASSTRSHRA